MWWAVASRVIADIHCAQGFCRKYEIQVGCEKYDICDMVSPTATMDVLITYREFS